MKYPLLNGELREYVPGRPMPFSEIPIGTPFEWSGELFIKERHWKDGMLNWNCRGVLAFNVRLSGNTNQSYTPDAAFFP